LWDRVQLRALRHWLNRFFVIEQVAGRTPDGDKLHLRLALEFCTLELL
jgi:hypothetical protein